MIAKIVKQIVSSIVISAVVGFVTDKIIRSKADQNPQRREE